ncbi:MAG: tryptophan--tRNA ligase [Bacilli bacterium]
MKRILTGIKPSGEFTLGNYIGAIKKIVELQEEYDSYIFIADLHAITVKQDPLLLKERIRKFAAIYIACGVDPKKNTIYVQSENEFIPSISWLLECHTYYGEASRMIQFKEKSKENDNFTVGLLTYPVLMAADILFCDSDYVPVGIDQKQHVELARDIAIRFNNQYGHTFTVPEPIVKESAVKIKDLKNPTKKMSKSETNPNGVITMFDTDEQIKKKIMGATTDNECKVYYDTQEKPGISNLMDIVVSLTNYTNKEIETKFEGKNYGEFKTFVAEIVTNEISKVREKYNQLINGEELDKILDEGARKSKAIAEKKYKEMKEKIGLIRK